MSDHTVVRLEAVSRTFGEQAVVYALRDCFLTLERGEYVAITGPSGSGKSTLLNVLGLLDEPSTGRYELEGDDISTVDDAHRSMLRAQRIGFVFQAAYTIAYRSVLENVAIGALYSGMPRPERRARARQLLDRVGLLARIDALPPTLSGGERQRVAIARALMNAPALLLCDEPTGNLDSDTAASILELLEELHDGGSTIVVVTHDPLIAERADRIVELHDGYISGRRTTE